MLMEQCTLCSQPTKKFAKSHIIPLWMYKWVDERLPADALRSSVHGQKWKIVSAQPNEYEKKSPNGIWDEFVCAACEHKFEIWDDYAAKILKRSPNPISEGEGWSFGDYNHEQLKLFFLSVLWRMHACKQDFFEHINVGEGEDPLRHCLLNESLGSDDEFTVMVGYWTSPLAHGFLPSLQSNSAWTVYLPFFTVLIGKGTIPLQDCYQPYVLRSNQPLFMIDKKLTEYELNNVSAILSENNKKKSRKIRKSVWP